MTKNLPPDVVGYDGYDPDNPIVTIDIRWEQMQKFAQNELKHNSLDSDAFNWLLTKATPEDIEKAKNLLQDEIWTLLTEGLHNLDALHDGLTEAYVTTYQARRTPR